MIFLTKEGDLNMSFDSLVKCSFYIIEYLIDIEEYHFIKHKGETWQRPNREGDIVYCGRFLLRIFTTFMPKKNCYIISYRVCFLRASIIFH